MSTDCYCYNVFAYFVSSKPNIIDKEYFDNLQQIIKTTYNDSKIELANEILAYKFANIHTHVFINGYFVNTIINKVCDWCNKSIQTKDLHNYYSCICKSESPTEPQQTDETILATRTDDTIRQDMCKDCFAKYNEFIDNGVINNLGDLGIIKVLPYDDEYIVNCNDCDKKIHVFEQYYKKNFLNYCKDCCEDASSFELINDDNKFGSVYDWIIIGKSIMDGSINYKYILCNLNPESKYYKNIGLLVEYKEGNEYYFYSFEDDISFGKDISFGNNIINFINQHF